MIANFLNEDNNVGDRALALDLQQLDPLKRDAGPALASLARRLAQRYLEEISERSLVAPSKVALFFEVEDADDAALAFTLELEDIDTHVAKACFWLHRRKNSFDKVIVEVGRSHSEAIADAELIIILQTGALCPEAVRAFLLHASKRVDGEPRVLILTSWSARDLEDAFRMSIPEEFVGRVGLGYFASGQTSAESRFLQSTRYSSQQRAAFPGAWEKNDFYPASVRNSIDEQMKLAREKKTGPEL